MKRIFMNDCFLKDEEIEFEVIRVKALIINSNDEILIAHNNGTYQFPGGHKEKDETLDDALIREIKEEIGINVSLGPDHGPFMYIRTYDHDYFGTLKKVCNKIYYYIIRTDEKPNFEETQYDELESQTDFRLFHIKMSGLKGFLEKAIAEKTMDSNIGREMLLVAEEYDRSFGGME